MPHRGIESASPTCRSDALPTELHPNRGYADKHTKTTVTMIMRQIKRLKTKHTKRLFSLVGETASLWIKNKNKLFCVFYLVFLSPERRQSTLFQIFKIIFYLTSFVHAVGSDLHETPTVS